MRFEVTAHAPQHLAPRESALSALPMGEKRVTGDAANSMDLG